MIEQNSKDQQYENMQKYDSDQKPGKNGKYSSKKNKPLFSKHSNSLSADRAESQNEGIWVKQEERKTDLRVIKTQNAIKNAFYELKKENPDQPVSVLSLCRKACINKSTFYDHYRNIDELNRTLGQELADQIIQSIEHPEYVTGNLEAFNKELFCMFLKYEKDIQILFSALDEARLLEYIENSLEDLIERMKPAYLEDPKSYILLVYQIHGGFYTFQKCRKLYGENLVLDVITKANKSIFDGRQNGSF